MQRGLADNNSSADFPAASNTLVPRRSVGWLLQQSVDSHDSPRVSSGFDLHYQSRFFQKVLLM